MLKSKSFVSQCGRAYSAGVGSFIACAVFLNALVRAAAPVPAHKPDAFPAWWFEREVIQQRSDPSRSEYPVWPDNYPPADDYAACIVGQLKNMAFEAAAELNAHLPGGAGESIPFLIPQWTGSPPLGATRDDYSVLTLGQLKAVAKLFYDQLMIAGYTNALPWANGVADDYAVANVGQLKALFAFDLTLDSDGDGIPDWWEIHYGLNPHDPSDAGLASGDGGFTNLQKYQRGLNPLTVDSDGDGIPDVIEIANGTDPTKKDAPAVGLKVVGYTAP